MRTYPLSCFALLVFASLPACKKLEEKAQDKVEQAAEKKIGISASGGVCDGWPATVPVYPGATDVRCVSLDLDAMKHGPIGQFIAAGASSSQRAMPDPPDLGQAGMMISYHVDVDRSKVSSFYASTLPYEGNAAGTAFANNAHPTDPVVAVDLLPSAGDPSAIVVSVVLQAKK